MLWRWLVWLDYTANDKLLHGRYESLSSRTYRNHRRYRGCAWLMRRLDAVDDNHCERMYLQDRARNPFIPAVAWRVPIGGSTRTI